MRAFLIVGVTSVIFWGIVFFFFPLFKDEIHTSSISQFGQISLSQTSLKSDYLQEIIGLSGEKPIDLISYSKGEGTKKLFETGLVQEAHFYKLAPSTLIVSYKMREPFAFIGNWKNVAVDQEGVLFPYHPFFPPKDFPFIFLPPIPEWDFRPVEGPFLLTKVSKESFLLSKTLILSKLTQLNHWKLHTIDLTSLSPEYPGKKEVVLRFINRLEEKDLYVRLSEENSLSRLYLIPKLLRFIPTQKKEIVLDMRGNQFSLVY